MLTLRERLEIAASEVNAPIKIEGALDAVKTGMRIIFTALWKEIFG